MRNKLFGIIAIFAAMFISFGVVKAEEYLVANENVIDEQTYEHSHFEAGSNVESKSTVNGLSFVAGANVNVSGLKEYGFFAGETVKVKADIEKDLFAAGNTVIVEKDAKIGRDAYLAGNSVTIETDINGAVFIGASMVKLENVTINGDVSIAANTVQIVGKVTINGRFKVNDDVVIDNENNLNASRKEKYATSGVDINFTNEISDIVLDILKTIFTGLILILVFPKLFKKIRYDLEAKDIGMKLLYGLLVLIAVPMISVFALSILVGMSVSIILLFLYIIAIITASIFSAAVIGQNIYTKIFKQKDNIYISFIIGILTIKLLSLLPYIGWIIALVTFLYGLGIIWGLFLERNK